MHGAIVGGLTMATDVLSSLQPSSEVTEVSEDVQKLKDRSSRIESVSIHLWDHIRDLSRDPQWYRSFSETLHAELQIETLAAILILDQRGRSAPFDEEIDLDTVPIECIWGMACRARSQHIDPVKVLMDLASPEKRKAADDALAAADEHMN